MSTRESVGPLKHNGTTVGDDSAMADILNNMFSSVFTKEDVSKIPTASLVYSGSSPLTTIAFQQEIIKEKIGKLRSSSAPGPDGLTPKLLQCIDDIILLPLTIIFAQSLKEGVVPEDWKTANVTPIYKKGSKANSSNYRPISLTCILCKVMESILRDAIVKHLATYKLIRPSQHGFMAHKSCLTNLLEYLEVLTRLVDEGHSVDIVYLDFAKAFDKVPHKRLLVKLHAHGIEGNILNWIAAWLSGRSQRVVLNGNASRWSEVHSGVPQGSVLGPTLFVIFINDIDSAMDIVTGFISKFADDTKVGRIVNDDVGRQALQNDLNSLLKWAETWHMSFNEDKCKVMHFGRQNPHFQYKMDDLVLESVDAEKDLGVMVHSSLKPSTQCLKASKKGNQILGQMAKAFHFRDHRHWVKLYKMYVRPHLDYNVQAWSPWNVADNDLLEAVQKRAVRMVSGLQGSNYEDKLHELGLPTLSQRRARADMIETWKILHRMEDVDPDTWFQMAASTCQRTTRQTNAPLQISLPSARLEIRKNFFSVRCVNQWNSLPDKVKQVTTVNEFKELYDQYVM